MIPKEPLSDDINQVVYLGREKEGYFSCNHRSGKQRYWRQS